MRNLYVLLSIIFFGCAQAAIKAPDGSTISGSLMNGQISYSAGAACAQVQPNPSTPIPAASTTTPPMITRHLCEANGGACRDFQVADPSTPICTTQTATVRGTDITTFFGWGLAAFATAALAFGGGL